VAERMRILYGQWRIIVPGKHDMGIESSQPSCPWACCGVISQNGERELVSPMSATAPNSQALDQDPSITVALLTGRGDRPYAYGLATELIAKGAGMDLIGSDDLDCAEFHGKPRVKFLNPRIDQRSDASLSKKSSGFFYIRLFRYAATAKPKLFHILWNNKFQVFDRTLLMLYYQLLGKKVELEPSLAGNS